MILVNDILIHLGKMVINCHGNIDNIFVKHLRPTEYVDDETLDWIGNLRKNKQQIAEESKAKVILCDSSVLYSEPIRSSGKVLIQVENPRMALALIAECFFKQIPIPGVHPSTVVHPEASIAPSVYIGPNCSIGKCIVGESSTIYANVTVYDNVEIGRNTVIHSGTVIGTDGLGCERKSDGTLVKFPHLGGVEIGDNVDIGANCVIARGSLSNTIIGSGCKINGMCIIAHNCILGKNVWISFDTTLAGSSRIEDNATLFSKVMVRDQSTIGHGAIIGMGSIVTKNIPAEEIWLGNPARKVVK